MYLMLFLDSIQNGVVVYFFKFDSANLKKIPKISVYLRDIWIKILKNMRNYYFTNIVKLLVLGCSLLACSCSSVKYVPEDKQLLNKVRFKSIFPI